ncbi:hypothetical protein LR48_Vigan02g065700 [Vigna angularis]|uniref:40S ribosomal protein S17 n=1 Tax=Phaseolus angularis TaxID=3914 RepID=A0A0L9TVT6_PHAAN|nr:hypothetical protein LR48_Vigan02g065700 [Vigna angularis]
MGRVRTKTVKKSSRQVIERYYSRMTLDFHTNKKVLEEVAIIPSKRLRNKIAGFSTHLMKRIQKGPVRGISLKLQEEERERRMDFVPEVSAIRTDQIEVDKETIDMLAALGMSDGGEHVDGLLVDLDLVGPDGRDFRDEVHAALALLLLQLEGDAAHWSLLDALHKVGGEAGDFVTEPL